MGYLTSGISYKAISEQGPTLCTLDCCQSPHFLVYKGPCDMQATVQTPHAKTGDEQAAVWFRQKERRSVQQCCTGGLSGPGWKVRRELLTCSWTWYYGPVPTFWFVDWEFHFDEWIRRMGRRHWSWVCEGRLSSSPENFVCHLWPMWSITGN